MTMTSARWRCTPKRARVRAEDPDIVIQGNGVLHLRYPVRH